MFAILFWMCGVMLGVLGELVVLGAKHAIAAHSDAGDSTFRRVSGVFRGIGRRESFFEWRITNVH